MRLLTKISYYHFWLSVVVLGITGFILFLFLQREITAEIEEQLELQTDMVVEELREGKSINFPLVQIRSGNKDLMSLPKVFKDTLIYDRLQNEHEGYYYFEESKLVNHTPYRIRVMTTYIGWGNYSKTISYIFITIACMLIVLGTLVNYFISRSLWAPFLINLKRMKGYSVSSKEELQLAVTDVKEFQEMNQVLTDLAERGRKEYNALKEFTENASHEIQTPLSILKVRLESISQMNIDEQLARLLNDSKQAVSRLSKVNKGLLLLAKLENNAFTDQQDISLDDVLQRNFDLMEDLFQQKQLNVMCDIQQKKIFASAFLMEILISNLLSNAIAYTQPTAEVRIMLNSDYFEISNQGQPLDFDLSRLFTRFGKGAPGYGGNGLGLSIVKQICVSHNWDISYNYSSQTHVFRVSF
ncbi:HAMP domain-containing sensor histidine kinase [Pedobacter nyackensis]|uniref:sensor histidine kinase n=1 Tax=Pedobacter nyackensis TaxID=475255 RepID=UPI00292D93E8|nr:HAMP domain-containing sensor histidine kinase [Pedobacter nyackensis]